MAAWKALAAFAIAVGAFAVYTFGWHDSDGRPTATRHHVITLREGDVVVRPEAAARCQASQEGGSPNLFCTRVGGGRHQIIFYSDSVLVWPLERGPDGPPFSYLWTPYVLQANRARQSVGRLELRNLRHMVSYRDAISVFGKATLCRLLGYAGEARATWASLGIQLRLSTLGGPPPGKNGCSAGGDLRPFGAGFRQAVADAQRAQSRAPRLRGPSAVSGRDLPAAAGLWPAAPGVLDRPRATALPGRHLHEEIRDCSTAHGSGARRPGLGILLPGRSGRRVALLARSA